MADVCQEDIVWDAEGGKSGPVSITQDILRQWGGGLKRRAPRAAVWGVSGIADE